MEGPKAAQSNRGVNQNKRPNSVEGALWRHDQILGGQMVRGGQKFIVHPLQFSCEVESECVGGVSSTFDKLFALVASSD